MIYKQQRSIIFLLFILITILSISCDDNAVIDVGEYPLDLTKIDENYKKIPSYSCRMDISAKSGSKGIQADGKAYIDKNNNRIKIILFDTLTEEILLDLVLINDKVSLYLFSSSGGAIITGNLKSLDLKKYIPDFNINLIDLVDLVKGKSYIFKNTNKIQSKDKGSVILYRLVKNNKTELISIDKKTERMNKLALSENDKTNFIVEYDKYQDFNDFYIPKRTYFFYEPDVSDSKTTIYISSIQFSPNFSNQQFKFEQQYTNARIIRD